MLSEAHGGKLINRVLNQDRIAEILAHRKDFFEINIDEELITEIQNIAEGVFNPLEGFLNQEDFESVLKRTRLANGIIWPIPIVLDIDKKTKSKIQKGQIILLTNTKKPIALLKISDVYTWDKDYFCLKVFKTNSLEHPGVAHTKKNMKEFLVGGEIDLIYNIRKSFPEYYLTPRETRSLFSDRGWETVVGFQTRNPSHRAHEYIQKCALEIVDGLFVNPVIGKKKPGDFKDSVILQSLQTLINNYFPKNRVHLGILPLRMRYAGPKEAILHAIIRKNFGCTHFIVGRDHAGVGDFYGTYEAQEKISKFQDLGITILKFEHSYYCLRCQQVATSKTCPHGEETRVAPSGTKVREMVTKKIKLMPEFTRAEVEKVLTETPDPFVEDN